MIRDLIGQAVRSALDGIPNLPGEELVEGLHPRIARLTAAMGRLGMEDLHGFPVTANRLILDTLAHLMQKEPVALPRVEDRRIPGPGGDLPARIYYPEGEGPRPVLLYFHGGGWVLGGLNSHDPVCRLLARESNCLVVSVEYRKAPEAPFPAATRDALAALEWVRENAVSLGGDGERIAVGGDSAGGNLSAVVSAQTRGTPARPSLQILFYPATDILPRTESARLFARGYFLTMEQIEWFRSHYVPNREAYTDPRVSPLLDADFHELPRTLMITAGFDPLRDDGKAYADKLTDAGVAVNYHCFDNMPHGFLNMTLLASEGEDAVGMAARELRAHFKV